jgi:hypothetical protein
MYESLRDLSQEWLLPGVEQVPANTVSLLVTNQRFIEAYMVGLNHEMARELLYNEYPTDQRGSYFRQFWEVAGFVPPTRQFSPESLKESLRDIHPIHRWGREAKLGENGIRMVPPGEDLIVLLVRGDLLLRYPNTIVYAAKASKLNLAGVISRILLERTEERHPIFRGTLKPDISFFGFNLTQEKAMGDPGWFFVLQEHATEPRFKDRDGLEFNTAAEFACETLADPVRVAIHASDMLKNL